MKDLIEDMVINLNTNKESFRLLGIKERIDTIGFNVIIINIIKWLELEYKRVNIWKTQSKPFKLDYECDWCKVIKQLVEEDNNFKSAFSITAGHTVCWTSAAGARIIKSND